MGYGWRRVTEAVRQKVVFDKVFQTTSNARNEAMFKETTEFCTHLKGLEKDLRSLQREVEGNFTNLRNILLSPLPRAYEEAQSGVAVACSEGDAKLIGQGIQADALLHVAQDLKNRLEEEVVKPLKHWYHAYKNIADRMTKLEQLRLELDSRRRTVDALQLKLERLRETRSANNKEKLEQELDKLTLQLQHKQDKLQRTVVSYREAEQMVFNSLNTLIKDSGVLRDYAGISLQLVQDCYCSAHMAFKSGTPMAEYTSTNDLYNQNQQHGYDLPIIEKVKSERAMMLRQVSERPRIGKDAGPSGAAMYAMSDVDASEPPYDQGGQGGSSGQPHHGQHYGGQQQYQQQHQDLPISSGPGAQQQPLLQPNPYAGATGGGNPYQAAYGHSPSAARYGAPPPASAAWQASAF